jgi:hypothetical protein
MATHLRPAPTLVLNPVDDDEFRGVAQKAVAAGAIVPSALQRAIRQRYSRSIVRPRDLAGERAEIWYVYRDGRWVRSGH